MPLCMKVGGIFCCECTRNSFLTLVGVCNSIHVEVEVHSDWHGYVVVVAKVSYFHVKLSVQSWQCPVVLALCLRIKLTFAGYVGVRRSIFVVAVWQSLLFYCNVVCTIPPACKTVLPFSITNVMAEANIPPPPSLPFFCLRCLEGVLLGCLFCWYLNLAQGHVDGCDSSGMHIAHRSFCGL